MPLFIEGGIFLCATVKLTITMNKESEKSVEYFNNGYC